MQNYPACKELICKQISDIDNKNEIKDKNKRKQAVAGKVLETM